MKRKLNKKNKQTAFRTGNYDDAESEGSDGKM